MLAAHRMRSLALALCLYHASAFAGVATAHGSMSAGGALQRGADRLLANAVPKGEEVQGRFGAWRRARGGAAPGQLWRRKAVAVPVDIPDQLNENLLPENASSEPQKQKGVLSAYLRALDDKPLPTKIITSGVICGVGDIMAQALSFSAAAGKGATLGAFAAALELRRFVIYAVLGAVWIAPVVHYWFDMLEAMTKSKSGPPKTFAGRMGKALKMVAVDQSIGAPMVNAGFMFLFALFTAIASGTGVTASVRKAGSMVRDSIWGTLLVCWKLWPVANLINFAFVPANLRVLFMNFVGLGWNIFLSSAVN